MLDHASLLPPFRTHANSICSALHLKVAAVCATGSQLIESFGDSLSTQTTLMSIHWFLRRSARSDKLKRLSSASPMQSKTLSALEKSSPLV